MKARSGGVSLPGSSAWICLRPHGYHSWVPSCKPLAARAPHASWWSPRSPRRPPGRACCGRAPGNVRSGGRHRRACAIAACVTAHAASPPRSARRRRTSHRGAAPAPCEPPPARRRQRHAPGGHHHATNTPRPRQPRFARSLLDLHRPPTPSPTAHPPQLPSTTHPPSVWAPTPLTNPHGEGAGSGPKQATNPREHRRTATRDPGSGIRGSVRG